MYFYNSIISVLNEKNKKVFKLIIIFLVFSMLLEALSIGMILPVVSVLLNKKEEFFFIQYFEKLNLYNTDLNLTTIIIGVFIIVILLKNLFLIFNYYVQTKFMLFLKADITQSLFNKYIKKNYNYLLSTNTSILMRNVTTEIGSFILFVSSYINIVAELMVIFGICILLLFLYTYETFFVISFILLINFIFFILVKGKLAFLGKKREFYDGELLKHLSQGFFAAKEVKLLNLEDNLINKVHHTLQNLIPIQLFPLFIKGITKYIFEILLVLMFSFLIFSLINLGKEMEEIILIVGIYSVTAFRLIPGFVRIFTSLQEIKFRKNSFINLITELNNNNQKPNNINFPIKRKQKLNGEKIISFNNSIKINNLDFKYETRPNKIFDKINLEIKKGEIVGIIGETGSGKSTLVNLICGLIQPENKNKNNIITVDDVDINENISSWQSKIGYVPQSIYLTDDTIKSNIAFGENVEKISTEKLDFAIKHSGLEDIINSLPDQSNTLVGEKGIEFSGGQQQRLGIARALYNNPELLIFDEATSALDINTEAQILDSLKLLKGKKTIIIITHRSASLRDCDKIYKIENFKSKKI